MMMVARRITFAVLALVLGAAAASAQAGYITGTVTDLGSGARLADVQVRAFAGTAATTTLVSLTDANGQYRINNVPAGAYRVVFTRIAFKPETRDVTVNAGAPAIVGVAMTQQAIQLNQIISTASRREEKALDAPATVSIVTEEQVNERPAITVIDHVRTLPGVDVASGGIQQSTVVTRGFNNIFSGTVLTLTDNRFAFVPSLRVNVPYLSPITNEDIERIEVVLGPGAALYGPNAVSGVMHVITRSPFDSKGTTLTIDGGERDYFRLGLRHAGAVGTKVGYKVSVERYSGEDWTSTDAAEDAIGIQRDFGVSKLGGEARVDWRPTDGTEIIGSYGRTLSGEGIEPTGFGGAQVRDWAIESFQLRGIRNRLFAQVFMNRSDAGETFLLRNRNDADSGRIIDRSTQLVGQIQHGMAVGGRADLIYGVDYLKTNPVTDGTINGRNEDDDDFVEIGGYVHSTVRVTPKFDIVGALRGDHHSRLEDLEFSPRAAIVFKPTEDQNIRLTYNRGYSTPTTNNQFIDRLAGSIPIPGTPGYGVRGLGTPKEGFQFRRDCPTGAGGLCMRSPFFPTSAFIPANAADLYAVAVAAVRGSLPEAQRPLLDNTTGAAFAAGRAQIGTQLRVLDPTAGTFRNVAPADVRDLDAIIPTISNTYEFGYKGILGGKLSLSFDVWTEKRKNFVGPVIVETPNVFLDLATLQTFLTTAFQAQGLPAANAAALAAGVAPGMAGLDGGTTAATRGVPLGVVNIDHPLNNPTDIVLAYRNFGELDVWGSDLAAEVFVSDQFSVLGTFSYVNKDFFSRADIGGVSDIALNAPKEKGSVAGRFRDQEKGLSFELRGRRVVSFPANSGVYVGPVPGYTLFDANAAWRPNRFRNAMVSLGATNFTDERHIEFVGGAELGRMLIGRLQYTF